MYTYIKELSLKAMAMTGKQINYILFIKKFSFLLIRKQICTVLYMQRTKQFCKLAKKEESLAW